MSAYNSGFVTGTNSIGGSSLSPFVPVHERPEELIDGGSAGEHYHLTQAQHTATAAIAAIPNVATDLDDLLAVGVTDILAIHEPVVEGLVEGDFMYEVLADGSYDVLVSTGDSYVT